MVNWRLVSPRLRPTNICVIQNSDTDLIPLWEPSQSTYWKLALASAPDLKISSQNLLHIHVIFPQLQAPTLDSRLSPHLKYARPDILAFYFSPSLASTFPHCFRRTILKKKRKSRSIYVRYQSTACVGTFPGCLHLRSKRTVPLICCRSCVSEFLHPAFFFRLNYVQQVFFFFFCGALERTWLDM